MSEGQGIKSVRRIAMIGNSLPRLCGIATYTTHVRDAMIAHKPELAADLYAMTDPGSTYAYGPEVVCEIAQEEVSDYHLAAQRINDSEADVVLVQHEYGIFGDHAGAHLLKVLNRVEAPVVVVLHTVLEEPNADQRAVIEALARRASTLIVMAEKGKDILRRVHGIAASLIAVVPHGVPDRPMTDPAMFKPRFGFAGHRVLLTFGLLSPNKGIETMIRALPALTATRPDLLYVVLGATHPHLVAREGEVYRDSLKALAGELGVSDNIRFIDGFLEQEDLLDYLSAADIYVTPYLNAAQITSGTLSYAVALGRAVVSTPYWHAEELLADGVGALIDFGSSDGFARAIGGLLDDPQRLLAMRERAYDVGRGMTWDMLADAYLRICTRALDRKPVRLKRKRPGRLDPVTPRLDAVERLSDGTGIIQHSIFSVPDRDHGYCVDDNCRALMLMHRMPAADAERADALATVYASFVQHAWNGDQGRFRNFMGFDRSWLEAVGSEDSFGRSLWSIGDTVQRGRIPELKRWALHLFDQVAPSALALGSQRAWAFCLFGAESVLRSHPSHELARTLVRTFADRLMTQLAVARRDDWAWFEATLAYDNARLPEALLRAGDVLGDQALIDAGLETLAWIDAVQTNPAGQFRAVGTDSFGREYRPPLPYDQQPLEAWASLDATALAYSITGDARWAAAAERAYRWYLGDNDVGLPLASDDGGCFDGLMSDRINMNQGAESVLAFQFACCTIAEMHAAGRGEETPATPVKTLKAG
ncbi:glycosyltransferase family 4 protein [Sphingomonas naphthae]|uniref:Glycosyltransferase family 4 protein n=1 Tax=Sphingomonas naphthae TaxID=1813468 RepID=A0ABY7TSA8_9SPHN|nr:glycosyltransferase family 4 protein [Sphingomonas naphthae]WCT75295.1 glycosyltransferase family 4 protein [Sphingomonas naphthae]